MKTITNILYLIFGCAVLLSSCRQEETLVVCPDGSDRRIVFHTSLPGLETRATEIVTDLTYFHLTAYDASDEERIVNGQLTEYFKNERIEKPDGSEKFASDRCVWPERGREENRLHFFAYYPELPSESWVNQTAVNDDGVVTVGYGIRNFGAAADVAELGVAADVDIAEQVDFVTAYATGSMKDNVFEGINLNFRHQLSRIEVKAKGLHQSCNIEIAGVSFGKVMTQGDFAFQTSEDADGTWTETVKGTATYIFREGDKIVTVGAEPVSIMGKKIGGDNDNCAMLIPSSLTAWAYDTDARNANEGLYMNVLLRVIDATNTAGKGQQRYPYTDNSQGLNALSISREYIAVDNNGVVTDNPGQLYKGDDGRYYTDKAKTTAYLAPQGSTVKEFGWAAVPISGNWQPGYTYTYTLDYTYGVGVHGPEVTGEVAPKAGDPIISDRVGVSLGFKDWQTSSPTGVPVSGN